MISAKRRFFWIVVTFAAIAIAVSSWGHRPSAHTYYFDYDNSCKKYGSSNYYDDHKKKKKKRKRCGESIEIEFRDDFREEIERRENIKEVIEIKINRNVSKDARNKGDVVGNIRRDLMNHDVDVSRLNPIRMKFHVDENGQVISYRFISLVTPSVRHIIKDHVYDFYFSPAQKQGSQSSYWTKMDLHI